MKILFLVIGKTDERYLEDGLKKYVERLKHYVGLEMKVIPDIKNRKALSEEAQQEAEAQLILAALQAGDSLVLLDENGKQFHSRAFAAYLEKQMIQSVKRLVFVVGGPYGFSEAVYRRSVLKISLSPMTFSHQLVRLIFAEQLYRAFTIIRGEPYHHD
ncbi:MAG: 23S rRNA (pseudouridine(1915)-N(3))-methyltransferase RlmH [Bacteroidetes bacterium]|nr:23S rRNA (pseudouridine(1915)-N(3))-methyltransferase RlmH [Bacteroidota bacterium]MBU1580824.1 23S rRNA (pseudouridine(1915)-N(3))-methyltransferase RlmH [Bacteroidota bacterium]MBU2556279.1 23S rRNA (pseudouridine(1915)-N(3))-methyltransferase RlmH [Bacteroidota bacterium]